MKPHLHYLLCVLIFFFLHGSQWITAQCPANFNTADNCADITSNQELYPITDMSGDFDFICHPGCMTDATPETAINTCGMDTIPVVWYKFYPDDDAGRVYINIETFGDATWSPVFAIFRGGCSGLVPVSTPESPACNLDWVLKDQINQLIDSDVPEYWIAVGADGDAANIAAHPNFTMCITTTINLIICLGDGSCSPETDWSIEDSNDPDQDLGPVDYGNVPTLSPGEEVELCGSFFYDATQTGVDWLIGIIPIFGNGWDMDFFKPDSSEVIGNGIPGQWIPEGIPEIQVYVGILCTYTDSYGNLQLCNVLCSTCPCTAGISLGHQLPGGYFWLSDGAHAGCENDGTPQNSWGIGSNIAQVDFCWNLKVRDDLSDIELARASLHVGFQSFSDGVLGCWADPIGECLRDEEQFVNLEIDTNAINLAWEDASFMDTICVSQSTDLQIKKDTTAGILQLVFEVQWTPTAVFMDTLTFSSMDSLLSIDYVFDNMGPEVALFYETSNSITVSAFDYFDSLVIRNIEVISNGESLSDLYNLEDFILYPDLDFDIPVFTNLIFCDTEVDTIFLPSISENGLSGVWIREPSLFPDTLAYLTLEDLEFGNNAVYFLLDPQYCKEYYQGTSTLSIEIIEYVIPQFDDLSLCTTSTADFPTTSTNGLSGSWAEFQNFVVDDVLNVTASVMEFTPDLNCSESVFVTAILYDETLDYYRDLDGDGFGDLMSETPDCDLLDDFVLIGGDCDDTDAAINPDAAEICDDLDNNCNGEINENLLTTYYVDSDMDGFGDFDNTIEACGPTDTTSTVAGDCDDTDAAINPDAVEICDDFDNNCDGEIDENLLTTYYVDSDMDGFGDIDNTVDACAPSDTTSSISGDCDDTNAMINPDAEDVPNNGIDENCDGMDAVSSTKNTAISDLRIYPNPTSDMLYIDSQIMRNITVYDLLGNKLVTERNHNQVSLLGYPNGIYLIEITDLQAKNRIITKVLKL